MISVRLVGGDGYLDHRQVAADRRAVGHIFDLDDVDQFVQVGGHPLGAGLVAVHDDGHARDAGLVGVPNGQRFDVEGPPAEQGGHPVQHAGFIFDKGDQGMLHLVSPHRFSMSQWSWMKTIV